MTIKDEIKHDLKRLEKVREGHEWTQKQMSEKLGVTRQTYNDWFRQDKLPSRSNWQKIKDYLEG